MRTGNEKRSIPDAMRFFMNSSMLVVIEKNTESSSAYSRPHMYDPYGGEGGKLRGFFFPIILIGGNDGKGKEPSNGKEGDGPIINPERQI